MSHEITKLNMEIKRLKTQNENFLSMLRNTGMLITQLRADVESLKAKAGGEQTGVLPMPAPEADKSVPDGVGGKVSE